MPGVIADPVHVHRVRVGFGDCDPAGIVYFPRFFHFFHEAMETWFDEVLGLPYAEMIGGRGLGFPAVHTEADFAVKGTGFRMGSPPFRIELLTDVTGVEFDAAWPRREEHDLDGVRCHVIGREDLIANNRAAGRPQDIADVRALERASKK